MSHRENAQVLRNCIEALLNADWDEVRRCYAEDAELIDPLLPDPVRGQDAIIDLYRECREHEPNMEGEIISIIAQDDMVAAVWVSRGTLATPFPGMPDSVIGKHIEIPEVNICRLSKGRIVTNVVYADTGAIMRQLDLGPN